MIEVNDGGGAQEIEGILSFSSSVCGHSNLTQNARNKCVHVKSNCSPIGVVDLQQLRIHQIICWAALNTKNLTKVP